MKTKLLTLSLLVAASAAFAQGKVGFGNDSLHLFIVDPFWVHPADAGLAGQPLPTGPLPSGVTLVAGLFAGTSSTSMTLQTATTPLTGTGWLAPGRMTPRSQLLTIPGGVPQWFRIVIYDITDSTPGDPLAGGYWGASFPFQCTPGTSLTYPSIMPGGPSGSTLLTPFNIHVQYDIPEPSSAALLLLGGLILGFSVRRHHSPN